MKVQITIFFTCLVRSEIICMMGIVPVQVQGSVESNEALYASATTPGVAVSGFHLTSEQRQESAVIGYAFESRKVQDESQVRITYSTLRFVVVIGKEV